MLWRTAKTLGGLWCGQQPALMRRISTAARGSQIESLPWKRAMFSFNGAAERSLRALPRTPGFSFRTATRRTFHSSKTRTSQAQSQSAKSEASGGGASSSSAAVEPPSLSARLKKLSREYGWAAVGVYLGLSLLDFPFCFLLVRTVGTEKIAEIEHVVVEFVKTAIPESVKEFWRNYRSNLKKAEEESGNATAKDGGDVEGWGVKEAEERNKRAASLATQLALAYAIHKSFIFVRVPLTAAVTPKVVKVLRGWGWKIGKQAARK